MRIGTGRRDRETGRYPFRVTLPFLTLCDIELEKAESTNERAPSMNVLCGGEKCGALWKREARGASSESFLSGFIESPLFPGGKLEIAVFHSKEVGGQLDMTWRPREVAAESTTSQRQSATPAAASSPSSAAAPSDDDDVPF